MAFGTETDAMSLTYRCVSRLALWRVYIQYASALHNLFVKKLNWWVIELNWILREYQNDLNRYFPPLNPLINSWYMISAQAQPLSFQASDQSGGTI